MNTFQKIWSALILSGTLGGCMYTPSIKIEWEPSDPKSVELIFNPAGSVYAKCVDRILDAKWYPWLIIHTQLSLNAKIPDCKLETIKDTLTQNWLTDIARMVPTTKK